MQSNPWLSLVEARKQLKWRSESTALCLVTAQKRIKRRKQRIKIERRMRREQTHAFYLAYFDTIKQTVCAFGSPVKHKARLRFNYEEIERMADTLSIATNDAWSVELFNGGVVLFLCSEKYSMITPCLFFVYKREGLLFSAMRFNIKLTHSWVREDIWKRS